MTQQKREIAKQDIRMWDGNGTTFQGNSATGRPITLDKVDWPGVDVYAVYGSRTASAISTACARVGTTSLATLYLSPGSWTMPATLDLSSYTNIYFHVPPGATLSIAASKTLTLYTPENIITGLYKTFNIEEDDDGNKGLIEFSAAGTVRPEWWSVSGTADDVEIQAAIVSLPSAGGVVQLAAKAYSTTTAIELASNVTLRGEGQITSIKPASTNGCLTITGTSGSEKTDVTISSMELDGTGTSGTEVGLTLAYADRIRCDNLTINKFSGSNYADTNSSLVMFSNCISKEGTADGMVTGNFAQGT